MLRTRGAHCNTLYPVLSCIILFIYIYPVSCIILYYPVHRHISCCFRIIPITNSDSDTSWDTTSSDSDTSKSEVSHTDVEESDIPPSRFSIISPKLSNGHKTSTPSSSSSEGESDDDEDDNAVG